MSRLSTCRVLPLLCSVLWWLAACWGHSQEHCFEAAEEEAGLPKLGLAIAPEAPKAALLLSHCPGCLGCSHILQARASGGIREKRQICKPGLPWGAAGIRDPSAVTGGLPSFWENTVYKDSMCGDRKAQDPLQE
ncbi:hypothetical protein lerEdw1_007164 [Lerista edwardsae]|nr:hypothetical protein lerEdw1_007164 [Lerista edwardsae]